MKKIVLSFVLLLFIVPVFHSSAQEIPSLFVQHQTKGKDLMVECIVTGISFRESNQDNQRIGKLIVWIDGKPSKEVTAAAFIIKGLPQGSHKVRIEVVKLTNEPYGLAKEFMVNVPK